MIERSEEELTRSLRRVSLNLEAWSRKVRREKAVYHVLNMLRPGTQAMIADVWCPADRAGDVHWALKRATVCVPLCYLSWDH